MVRTQLISSFKVDVLFRTHRTVDGHVAVRSVWEILVNPMELTRTLCGSEKDPDSLGHGELRLQILGKKNKCSFDDHGTDYTYRNF
jgi:hypothetical protein